MNINPGVLDGVRRIGGRFRDVVIDGGTPGAPLGFRLRGATVSGAPTAGTWKAGDETRDRNGAVWICTTPGTPGTWTQAGLPGTWLPSDFGIVSWTYDPLMINQGTSGTSQTVYLAGIQVRYACNITKIYFGNSNAASSVNSGQNWVGLYNSAANLVSGTATSADSRVTSTGFGAVTITSTALTAGMYWVALLFSASTMPTIYRAAEPLIGGVDLNQVTASSRYATGSGSSTTLPSSITVVASNVTNWAAIG